MENIEADLKSLVLDSSFDPTDDQLITQYLRKKIANQYVPPHLIADVNLYQHHPKDLPESYPHLRLWLVDEWYFFSPRDLNESRAAGNGYWKATGTDKPIYNMNNEIVGFKQELVLYEGLGERTNWIMHEYKDVENIQRSNDMMLNDWVLCRIYYEKIHKPLKEGEKLVRDEKFMQEWMSIMQYNRPMYNDAEFASTKYLDFY